MTAAAPPAWNLFKQIFADHWDGFKRAHPRYDRRYYDGLVEQMLGCGNPDQMGAPGVIAGKFTVYSPVRRSPLF